ncbi:S8 family serine peptidase [Halorubellus sp. PRR65]|uniref:S8 family serine peptidase n=1 Tax=Halorubellus sp. PRR65 TaxID=3098148 RepID=UPI002B25C9F7|nr:S8 family serine peptidase [Halorubellus sp. PRR65]
MSSVSARTVLAVSVVVLALVGSLVGVAVPGGNPAPADPAAAPPDDGDVDAVHADGVTGDGVDVAVLDPTGFDTDDDAYADAAVAARTFGSGPTIGPNAGDVHGTRSARQVAAVAPNASLHLAGFDGETGYGRAMAWAVRQGVDVVVVPAAFHGKPGTGDSVVENVTSRAVARGVVVVAAAGNTARGTYRATYDRVRNGALVVDGSVRNYLRGDDRVVRAWLSWTNARPGASYALELYRVTETGPRLVARSVPYEADSEPNARLNVRVEPGTHFLVVRGPDRPTGATVRVTSATNGLQHVTVRGSLVAPATAEGVVAVGAWNPVQGRLAAYSSSGPTLAGRQGVDVVATARADDGFRGSSVAAARAGGVAALVRAARPNATPAAVGSYLEATARDVGVEGVDARTGGGLLRPERAVAAALADARNGTRAPESTTARAVDAGDRSDGSPIPAAAATLANGLVLLGYAGVRTTQARL